MSTIGVGKSIRDSECAALAQRQRRELTVESTGENRGSSTVPAEPESHPCVSCAEEFDGSEMLLQEGGHICLACSADADADESLASSEPSWTRALHFVPGYALIGLAILIANSGGGSLGKGSIVAFVATLIGMALSMFVAAEGVAGLTGL